jgi:hypothetical protein
LDREPQRLAVRLQDAAQKTDPPQGSGVEGGCQPPVTGLRACCAEVQEQASNSKRKQG